MNYLGIEAEVRNLPELDRDFFPLYKFILFFYRPQVDAQSLGLLPGGKPGGDEF